MSGNSETKDFRAIIDRHFKALENCNLCPRRCGANRLKAATGFCKSGSGFHIASICSHKGEEPVISGTHGICNVFFGNCNLQCRYCQNWQISKNTKAEEIEILRLETVLERIISLLNQGCESVGFVSPSHFIPHVKVIIDALRLIGHNPIFVYNSNGYDSVEQLNSLEGYIDVYLPDFKYADPELAKELSGVKDYPEMALAALKEMFRQKGSTLQLNEKGIAENGMVVRHLILPGYVQNSLEVLRLLSYHLSESVAVSLMSQYWPTPAMESHASLNRTLDVKEYDQVVKEMENLGFYKGWVQELESSTHYRPDFSSEHPFER
ncbi:MAG: radical SAM protein [Bacteroidales bacterium]|nr:radical SAM protein [Bacteroidales bacterium]